LILNVNVGFGPTSPTEKLNRFLTAMRALKELLTDGVLTGYGLKFEEVCTEVFGASATRTARASSTSTPKTRAWRSSKRRCKSSNSSSNRSSRRN
jgi:hypothetical protein